MPRVWGMSAYLPSYIGQGQSLREEQDAVEQLGTVAHGNGARCRADFHGRGHGIGAGIGRAASGGAGARRPRLRGTETVGIAASEGPSRDWHPRRAARSASLVRRDFSLISPRSSTSRLSSNQYGTHITRRCWMLPRNNGRPVLKTNWARIRTQRRWSAGIICRSCCRPAWTVCNRRAHRWRRSTSRSRRSNGIWWIARFRGGTSAGASGH